MACDRNQVRLGLIQIGQLLVKTGNVFVGIRLNQRHTQLQCHCLHQLDIHRRPSLQTAIAVMQLQHSQHLALIHNRYRQPSTNLPLLPKARDRLGYAPLLDWLALAHRCPQKGVAMNRPGLANNTGHTGLAILIMQCHLHLGLTTAIENTAIGGKRLPDSLHRNRINRLRLKGLTNCRRNFVNQAFFTCQLLLTTVGTLKLILSCLEIEHQPVGKGPLPTGNLGCRLLQSSR